MMERIHDAYVWVQQIQIPLYLVLLLFLVWWYAFTRKVPSARREPQMVTLSQEETQKENSIIADAVHDGLFKAYCDGRITRERYRYECYRLGTAYGITDLRPRRRSVLVMSVYEVSRLKDEIKRRLPKEKVKLAIAKAAPKPKGNGKLIIPMKGTQP